MSEFEFTVGDLKRQLQGLDDDDELQFSGGLTFYRIKRRGDQLQVLEFGEPTAYLGDDFRKRNPHIQVAFVRLEPMEEGQLVQEVDVSIR